MSNLLCPSSICQEGSSLIGIITSEGTVNYLDNPIKIDKIFVEEAYKGRDPHSRFRFAGNCAKNGCEHWNKNGKKCGLIEKLEKVSDSFNEHCEIRAKCRWYNQKGIDACKICTNVIRYREQKYLNSIEVI
jgi:hypothetical protein